MCLLGQWVKIGADKYTLESGKLVAFEKKKSQFRSASCSVFKLLTFSLQDLMGTNYKVHWNFITCHFSCMQLRIICFHYLKMSLLIPQREQVFLAPCSNPCCISTVAQNGQSSSLVLDAISITISPWTCISTYFWPLGGCRNKLKIQLPDMIMWYTLFVQCMSIISISAHSTNTDNRISLDSCFCSAPRLHSLLAFNSSDDQYIFNWPTD